VSPGGPGVDTESIGKKLAARFNYHQVMMSETAKKEALTAYLAEEITKYVHKPGFILDGAFNAAHIEEFEQEVPMLPPSFHSLALTFLVFPLLGFFFDLARSLLASCSSGLSFHKKSNWRS